MTTLIELIRTTSSGDMADLAKSFGGFPGGSTGHNDAYDAFQHAYASALYSKVFGSSFSESIMTGREDGPLEEQNMDKWNNNVGREEYKRWKDAKEKGTTTDSLAKWIYDQVKEGKTINDLNDTRKWKEPPSTWDKFKEFIDDLQNLFESAKAPERIAGRVNAGSPLILDLDGDGIETLDTDAGIHFDQDGNRFAETSGWVGKDDGLLVWDKNANGQIDSGAELFGNNTVLSTGSKADNGFTALADLDNNHDGKLDAQDSTFANLRVWKDSNSDGLVQNGELLALDTAGVQSLNTQYSTSRLVDANGNEHRQVGSYTKTDGSTAAMTDVWFKLDTARTIDQDLLEIDATIAAMPDLAGFGNVHSLHQALARDSSGALATLIQEFVNADRSNQAAVLDQLIFTWAGAAGVEPGSRGGLIDARKLTVLEAFMGEAYLQNNTSSTPGGGATFILNGAYDTLVTRISGQLLLQTVFKPLIDSIQLTITENRFTLDVSEVAALMQSHYETNADQGVADMVDFGNSLKVLGDAGTELLNNLRQLENISGEGYELFLAHIGNLLLGDTGINALNGNAENEVLMGLADNDYITGGDGDDQLIGGQGNDRLYGHNGEDVLSGGEGSDSLYGSAGNDILDGGAGYDTLDGGPGSDTYLFGRGSGQDWIKQFDAGVDKLDTIQLGADILTTDIRATRSGASLVLSIVDTADKLTVLNYFLDDGENGYKVDAIKFSDGTSWDMITLKEKVTQGTDGRDVLQGYAIADTLNGLAGNDSIIGNAGDDMLDGGEGDDYIIGGDGDDQLKGSQGNDRLYGYNGEDVLSGGEGSDSLYGSAGNDILDGGAGYDTLDGGPGSDTYLFGRGSGQDWIKQYDAEVEKLDTIQLGADILTTDIRATRSGSSLVLSIVDTADKLTVLNYFLDDGENGYKVDAIKFSDGTSWDMITLKEKVTQGTAGRDVLQGYAIADTLNGLAGNDSIIGNAGDDTLDGGEGDDYIIGGDGDDHLKGSQGNDRLYGYNGEDVLSGGEGSDSLYGGSGNDILDGGAGHDRLDGGSGSDTYLFGRGSGQDWINQYDAGDDKLDTIQLGADILQSDVIVTRSHTSLELSIAGTSDKLAIINYFADEEEGGYKVDAIKFADGSSWDLAILKEKVIQGTAENDVIQGYTTADTLSGRGGNDSIYGNAGNDTLNGGEGADKLYGNAGNDRLDGGAGNDSLDGGAGSDTYMFSRGSGQDVINQYDTSVSKQDSIQLGSDISTTDIIVTRSGSSLVISIADTADKLTVMNYFVNDGSNGYKVDEIRFADGSSWDLAAIKDKVIQGTAGTDILQGYTTADILNGLAGNDSINGNAGNDILNGGAGNDTLNGGAGSDTYLFNRGSGQDTIYNYDTSDGNLDTIQLGSDISESDILATRSGSNLVLSIANTSDRLIVTNYFINDGENSYIIDRIRFTDGTNWDLAKVKTKVTGGSAAADFLQGSAQADTLSGLAGNDRIYGNAGDDILDGGADSDYIYGGEGNDQLEGGLGNDYLYGDNGNDVLNGSEGNDNLTGGAGNDVLNGGAGNDSLIGGTGSDTYLFGRDSGRDTIYNYDTGAGKLDSIQLGADVVESDIVATRSSSNLMLSIAGTTDVLTVYNYFINDGVNPYTVEAIKFADGTNWDVDILKAKVIVGSAAADSLQGYATADSLNGLAGNDRIYGNAGNDILDGGADNDSVYGGEGDDQLEGGLGNDYLYGDNGNDMLNGSEGNDNLTGGAGNDVLDGGAGNDTVNGGTGSDTYLFGRDSGRDTIYNYDIGTGKLDTIQLGADIVESDIVATRSSSNLMLSIAGTSDVLTVYNYFINDGVNPYTVEAIKFADGTNWDVDILKAKVIVGSAAADSLQGYATADSLNGLAGNDRIYGNAGNDILDGGADNDSVYGGEGDDQLEGGLGNDYLYGDNGNDMLNGSEGNDNLTGGAGNDVLDGGAGNDHLNGGTGSDTYIFNLGNGRDVITNYESANNTSQDILKFGEGISANDLWFSRKSNNLVVDHIGSDDQVQINNWFLNTNHQIEQISVENAVLHSNQVINLVNAMSAFNAPTGSGAIVPQDVQEQLAPVLATSWTPAG